ncbi:unnamed protein product [Gongylonema pulchrum]|uniref:Membrane-associated kinase regulator 6 n=1 Tax=Gongylonema pulchrum TaxID=637853 RepID=A0A183CWY6_9BILA|nr:unnamed protein product [Gongylonema pulchrum]
MQVTGRSFTISLSPAILLIFLIGQRKTEAARWRQPFDSSTSFPKSQASALDLIQLQHAKPENTTTKSLHSGEMHPLVLEPQDRTFDEFMDFQLVSVKHDHSYPSPAYDIHTSPPLSSSAASLSLSQSSVSCGIPPLHHQHNPEEQPWRILEQFATLHFKFPALPGSSFSDSSDSYSSQTQLQEHSVFGDKVDQLYKPPFMVPSAAAEGRAEIAENRPTFSPASASAVKLHLPVAHTDGTFTNKRSTILKLLRKKFLLKKRKPPIFHKVTFADAQSTQAQSKVNLECKRVSESVPYVQKRCLQTKSPELH